MRAVTKIILILCLILTVINVSYAFDDSRKVLEVELHDYGWESDMATLDGYSNQLLNESNSTGYIIIYGARHGRRGEAEKRMKCMKSYLIERRGIHPDRIKVSHGGYRERSMMELWIVPHGGKAPTPTRTVKPKGVRLRKGKIRYSCDV